MVAQAILNRALGAYLGLACGDALGATVEFMSPKRIQRHYGVHRDIIGGGWLALAPGQVTDDTQMSLALGRAIVEQRGWKLEAVADHFVAWLESEPPDIGDTCRRGILRYRDTGKPGGPVRTDEAGNGACMRNLPVVLATLYDADEFRRWSLEQSHITHHNPLSDAAVLAFGNMTGRMIAGQPPEVCEHEARRLIDRHPQFAYQPYPGKASAYIVDTVQTVLHHFFGTADFESCLIATVNQGGDADTTGALAGMLAGARYGLDQIPQRWLERLDPTVSEEIRRQCTDLLAIAESCADKGNAD